MVTQHATKWYRFDRLDKYNAPIKVVIGERGNGKTYATKDRVLNKYANDKGKFLYLRRTHKQIKRQNMRKVFEDIYDKCYDILGGFVQYSSDLGFYYTNGEDETPIIIGFATSLEDAFDIKGIPWNEITTIWFEEFLEYGNDMQDEIARFLNIVSTVVRKRDNVEIIMLANTVTRYSIYFSLLGINPTKLKQGEIGYIKHENGAIVTVEYCSTINIVNGEKAKNKYLGFDNNATTEMILYGAWEYDTVNISNIDTIGWSCKRYLIPVYLTALGEVFEMSVYESDNPILFVRKINTQNGIVRKEIEYNLSYDDSLHLYTSKGEIVPMYGRVSKFMGTHICTYMDIVTECLRCKRVVYDKMDTGSDFKKIYDKVR